MNADATHEYRLEKAGIDEIAERPGLRNTADDLSSLEKSITELGLLFPLLVNNNNILISGHRRLQACRNLGMETVPVLRVDADEDGLRALEILIQENLCRRELKDQEVDALIGRKKRLLTHLRTRGTWHKIMEFFRFRRRISN